MLSSDQGGGSPLGGGRLQGGAPGRFGGGSGVFGTRRGERFEFAYAPVRRHGPALPDVAVGGRGLTLHDVGRHGTDRPSSRGLRFAFVAAGAVSLAAIALGGVAATGTPTDTEARGAGKGSSRMSTGGGASTNRMRAGTKPAALTRRRSAVSF